MAEPRDPLARVIAHPAVVAVLSALGAPEPVRWYRLGSYFEDRGVSTEAVERIKRAVGEATLAVTNCGRNLERAILEGRTDGIDWVVRCSGTTPGEADAEGALNTVRRMKRCLDLTLRSLDTAIQSPDRTPDRIDAFSAEVENTCRVHPEKSL